MGRQHAPLKMRGVSSATTLSTFGLKTFGGLGGVTFQAQLVGSLMGAAAGLASGALIYWFVDAAIGFRLSADEEREGADLAIHKISASPEDDVRSGRM